MMTKCLKLLSMSEPGDAAASATVCHGLRHSISELIERLLAAAAAAAAAVRNVFDLIPQ